MPQPKPGQQTVINGFDAVIIHVYHHAPNARRKARESHGELRWARWEGLWVVFRPLGKVEDRKESPDTDYFFR